MLDILSRNFWYNDDIVGRFYTKYNDENPSFNKNSGDVLSTAIYDDISGKYFNSWIATTRTGNLYFKVTKGATTMLYRRIGSVYRTEIIDEKESKKRSPKVSTYNIYAVVPKAGLHSGKINYFEFYCNYTTSSIFEQNKIIDSQFALDVVKSNIQQDVSDVEKLDKNNDYIIDWENEDDVIANDTYVSTNSDIYVINETLVDHSQEQETDYAKIARSSRNMDYTGVKNSDCVINFVQEDKGSEVNRSGSKPLQAATSIVDAVLDGDTSNVIKYIAGLGKSEVSVYVTSAIFGGYQASKEEIEALRQKKISENAESSLDDSKLNYEIFGQKLEKFLNNLVLDLKMNNIKVAHLSSPFNYQKQELALAVLKTHKTHCDYFTEKAILYPSDNFVKNKSGFRSVMNKFDDILDDVDTLPDGYYESEQEIEDSIQKLEQETERQQNKVANKSTNVFMKAASLEDVDVYENNEDDVEDSSMQISGDNIASGRRGTSELARKLTNKYNEVSVEYKGTVFKNAEHAYQTWKSGSFDQSGFDAQGERGRMPADKNTNYQTMVEILTAKFEQHPELVDEINKRGGVEYLKQSTHNVLGRQNDYWETSGQNKFIEALIDAYNNYNQPDIQKTSRNSTDNTKC